MSSLLDIRALESRAFRAWPALETRTMQGWVQRLSGGYTKRANSINALDPHGALTGDLRMALEAPYRQRDLPPVWRLTPLAPAGADALLAEAGYRRIDESLVQRATLDGRFAPDPEVRIAPAPAEDWLAGFAALSPVAPLHREAMARLLRSIAAPVGFAQVEENGHFGQSCSYGHGIATYALAECYALTQDGRLRAPLELALAEILRHQRREADPRLAGGWGYYFADGHVWNGDEWPRTSVTAWQVMALESARLSGLTVPDQAFEGAREFLLNTWDPRARAFRYDHDPARLNSGYPILPASTPAALFALSLLGVDAASAELAQARRFVLTRQPDGYRYTGDDDFVEHARGNLYFWYYATLAIFRVGGSAWESWNGALKETLLPAQDEDGSWRPIDTYAEYAGDEDEERTYTTAMCVLSLEIYYRYFTPLLRVK